MAANWSSSKYTDAICIVITVVMVAITIAFMNGETLGLTRLTSDTVADETGEFSARDLSGTWSASSAIEINLDDLDKLESNAGAYVLDGDLQIVSKGTYVLRGTLTDHQVIVNAKGEKVQLVLDGVTMTHSELPVIQVEKADKVFLTLAEGRQNVIKSTNLSSDIAVSDDLDAAIYAKADLSINGGGSITVEATGGHGIKSSDDLIVTGGSLTITADSSALVGKDSVRIADGSFVITAGNDGIRSRRTDKDGKGYIVIKGGDFQITAGGDGIQAAAELTIDGGNFTIVTNGGSANAPAHVEEFGPGGGFGGPRNFDNTSDNNANFPEPPDFDGNFPEMTDFTPPDWTQMSPVSMPATSAAASETTTSDETDDTENADSHKGIKAGGVMIINGGSFDIDASDDAVHSDDTITINGGTLVLRTGDDGVHADNVLTVNAGSITVLTSYEGLEASEIYVNGGEIEVTSSDDGINAGGNSSTDDWMMGDWGRRGASGSATPAPDASDKTDSNTTNNNSTSETSELPLLEINGGKIVIDADGDGLDSNGNLIINGGDIIVHGPTNSGNGALDSGSESGGDLAVHGGTIVALGAAGMDESFSSNSTQYSLRVTFTSNFGAGQTLTISDGSETIATYTIKKSGNSVVYSSNKLQAGQSYTVAVGDQIQTITLDQINAGASEGGGFGGGMRMGRGQRGDMSGDGMQPPDGFEQSQMQPGDRRMGRGGLPQM